MIRALDECINSIKYGLRAGHARKVIIRLCFYFACSQAYQINIAFTHNWTGDRNNDQSTTIRSM